MYFKELPKIILDAQEKLSLLENEEEFAHNLENQRLEAIKKYNKLANKYTPLGSGAVLAFEIKGGIEAGKKFIEALKLHSHVANIGDVRSLAIHPASTTHSQLTAAEQLTAGVTPGLVRLSVGIENIADIKADLEKAFAAAK